MFFLLITQEITPKAIIEIAILFIVIYLVISFLKETRGISLVLPLLIFFAISSIISNYFELGTIDLLISKILEIMTILIIVVFHPEIRHALIKIGSKSKLFFYKKKATIDLQLILDAAYSLSKGNTGALMVLERGNNLSTYADTGTNLNAETSISLIKSIFCIQTPLHDGAIIIKKDRIVAAGCFLPLTKSSKILPKLGARHRAGIGITEETDCLCIIVSEENGSVSVAVDGKIFYRLEKEKAYELVEKTSNYEKVSKKTI